MNTNSLRHRALALVIGIFALAFSGWASADPPSRVARLGYVSGAVSFSPAGEDDWVQATLNRPLTTGDRLWADPGARAEIQIGGAMVRMSSGTSVSVLNLDDQITQLQLTQGALNVRVLRLERGQMFEVDTPNVAFTLRQPGEYRIDVDPEGRATTIVVRRGEGEVYGEDAAFVIDARQPYRFEGTGLREYQHAAIPQPDDFDRWSRTRDRSYDASVSARYVSPDVVGYQDLDAHGTWRVDATYGNVWFPSRVAVGWAPYSAGHWAWIHPWGWTWVDDAPWGYAVSHYGRWANLHGTWGWVPGPVRTRAYYAPALVVFIGGANFQLSISSGNVGGVGWFPLGPREVYQPAYPVSRRYYEDINRSNTVINNTVINNTYNNINVTNVYANQRVQGAVVAVPATAFVQSQPVSRAAVRVSQEVLVKAPVTVVPVMAPTEISVRGNAAQGARPPARVLERPVVARTAPPPAPVGFAAQQPQLASKPGKPLDDAARRELKPVAAAPAVKVIEAKVAQPTTRLPPVNAGPAPADARGKADDRKAPAAAPVAEPKVPAPAPTGQPPQQRERTDQPGKGNQQRAPSPPAAVPAPPVPPQVAPAPKAALPAAPVAQPPEQRERADQPGKGSQQRAASPPVAAPAPQINVPPTPKAAPLPPAAQQPPEQRERADQPGKGSQQRAPSPPVAAPAPQINVPPTPKAAPLPPAAQQPPEQRERADQPGKGSQQRAPSPPVAAPAPPPAAPQVKAAPAPTAAPQAPVARPPEQRDKPEQTGKGGGRTPPVATPPPPAAPPAAAPPVPKVAPPAGDGPARKSPDMKKDKEKDKEEPKA